jgi:Fe-Mn family superoxide dismutase
MIVDINCANCTHSWETNTLTDPDPYLCHNCGLDNQTMKFEPEKLKNWRKSQMKEEKIPGGKAEGLSLIDIAKHHKMPLKSIKVKLDQGIKTEIEHTTDKSIAREIAMDHIYEDPNYYTKLKQIETEGLEEDGQKTSDKNMDDYKKQNNPSGKVKDPFGLNQFARELAMGLEEADPKTGTGKKPKGSSRRLYTDEDPSDTVKVKFSTRQDIVDTLSKTSFKSKSHARQSQIINLIHQRVRAAYERAKDPDVKRRLKTALDYAEQRKEASKEKTERLRNQKENLNEQKQDMKFKVPKLNYSYTSLEPYIDKETMEEHFDKHFKGYTDKLNAELDVKSIKVDTKDPIQAIQTILGKYPKNDIIRNNGGGFYNHVLYFENMTPDYKAPSTKFREMLEKNFNSFSEFKEQFKEAGLKQFGSGWVFLIKKGDKLVIESYANQDNPYLDKDFKGEILIAMDVWEHSYYLKHKSQRGNYIDDFFRVVDYKVAEERLEEEPITENVAPNHDSKSAPFGSGYKELKEKTGFGGQSRYRAIEKRGDKYYYIQDNPFAPGIRQEFGPYKTKEQAKKKMETFPPAQNYRDITENDSMELSKNLENLIPELVKFMSKNGLEIQPLPKIKFITDDEVNANDPLGITAFYDPANATIVLYTMGRHVKDILRSLAHELVHHEQNLNKTIGTGKIKTTNTLEDDYLDKIEREAYEKGNIIFRNWTDSLKK